MNQDASPIVVKILDKEYEVFCEPKERGALLRASAFLDRRMQQIRESGKVMGMERIAIMAALNLSHEMLMQADHSDAYVQTMDKRIQQLKIKINNAIGEDKQSDVK